MVGLRALITSGGILYKQEEIQPQSHTDIANTQPSKQSYFESILRQRAVCGDLKRIWRERRAGVWVGVGSAHSDEVRRRCSARSSLSTRCWCECCVTASIWRSVSVSLTSAAVLPTHVLALLHNHWSVSSRCPTSLSSAVKWLCGLNGCSS